MNNEKRKYCSLFGGIGGFDVALQEEGWTEAFYNDHDKFAVQTYNKNFGTNYKPRDIQTVGAEEIPDIKLLCGGFPCQTFSIAGKRAGFEDTRGTMFFEIARILKDKKPEIILLENVKGLLNHDKGRTFGTILRTLDDLGYDAEWCVLNSKDFGVPHNRERVYIIGYFRGKCGLEIFPIRGTNEKDTRTIGEDLSYCVTSTYAKGKYGKGRGQLITINNPTHSNNRVYDPEGISPTLRTGAGGNQQPFIMCLNTRDENGKQPPQQNRAYDAEGLSPALTAQLNGRLNIAIPVQTCDRAKKSQNGRRMKENGDEMYTLTAIDRHGIYDGKRIRKLTEVETERLQGFPDGWTEGVSSTQRYKQTGNAVTTNVVRYLIQQINKQLENGEQ